MKKSNVLALIIICLGVFALWQKRPAQQHSGYNETYSENVVTESGQTNGSEPENLKESVRRVLENSDGEASGESVNTQEQETEAGAAADSSFEENGYYYSQLTDVEKQIYAEIYGAIVNRKEVKVSTLSADVVDKINICVTNDHPEIFNVYGYTYTTHTVGDELASIMFRAKYVYDEAESARIGSAIEAEVSQILINAPAGSSDFEKIKYVYDTLVNNTSYREDAKDNQNIASVFLYHESVCQGYAKATQYLLNRLGIEATLVVGETKSGAHSWNLVKADGAWYYLDTTWGDADFQNEEDGEMVQNARPVSYDYFLVDSFTLLSTHSPNRTVPLPQCTAKEDNYFIHENLYLTGLDTEIIQKIFQNGYDTGAEAVQFKCSNSSVYEQVKSYLIEDQHIFDFVKKSASVSYTVFEDTNTFCFWLFNS